MDVGFIGLGNMGSKMAANLIKGGHRLWVYDKDPEALARAGKLGAVAGGSAREISQGRDVVFLSLTFPDVVQEVVLGPEGVLAASPVPKILIDTSTGYPPTTRRLAAAALEKGCQMLDVPVTGRPQGAAAGTLSMMVGGAADAYERALPLLRLLGRDIFYVGESGSGHAMKLVNNVMTGSNRAAAIEALMMGTLFGLDPKVIYQVVTKSTGNSRAFEEMVPRLLKRDFENGFAIELMHKDLDLISRLGQELGMPMPVVNLVKQIYQAGKAAGLGREDTAAVATLMERLMGVEIRSWEQ